MGIVEFDVIGQVLGKPRPRVNKNGMVWTPKRFKDYENHIAQAYIDAGGELLEGVIELRITTFREMPKSRPKKMESEPDTFKPDIDNVAKTVLDALNGVAYKDDRQVVKLSVVKAVRTRNPEHMVIKVKEIGTA